MFWVTAAFAGDPCADPAAVTAGSAEIKRLYDAGEQDRNDRSSTATSVLERDEERVKAIVKLDNKVRLCTAEDKWHAAWLMTQADDLDVLTRAYDLAQEAMNAHHPNGAWLVAFTFDHLCSSSCTYRPPSGGVPQWHERPGG